jgi:hypothetical protein
MSQNTELHARECGYRLISSEYNVLLKNQFIIINDRIPSLFLEWEKPNREQCATFYPVVALLHDYDIVRKGIGWLENVICSWREAGVQKYITFKELVGYLLAEVTSVAYGDRISISIDLSQTGNGHSGFFTNNKMELYVQIPKGRKVENLSIRNHSDIPTIKAASNGFLAVSMQPFMTTNTATIDINLSVH